MAKLTSVIVALVVVCATLTAAAPCIECKDCQGMTSCLKTCQQTCPKQQVVVNGFACDSYGKSVAGPVEASRACELAMKYCDNPAPGGSFATTYIPVPLSQCANIAFGACQKTAENQFSSPCGQHFKGYKQCSGGQFRNFYTGVVNDACHQAVKWIQNL